MELVKVLKSCVTSFFVKKIIMQTVKDTVDSCLTEGKGLGCLYYTVIKGENDISLEEIDTGQHDYFVIINHNKQYYHIVKDNIVIFQGDYRADQDPVRIAKHDFVTYRRLSTAIELAALGQWETCEKYVADRYKEIIKDIEYMDVRCGPTAHELRLRMET